MKNIYPILFLMLFASQGFAGEPNVMSCKAEKSYSCIDTGCESHEAGNSYLIDLTNHQYYRCDKNGCDDYNMTFVENGSYINGVIQNGSTTTFKFNKSTGKFIDTASFFLVVIINFGLCEGEIK